MAMRLRTLNLGVLWVGLGCAIFTSLLIAEMPAIKRLEFKLQDTLSTWRPTTIVPTDDIVLIQVKESDLISSQGEQARYTALVEQLLQQEAAVVVLNLLDNWTTEIPENGNLPLQQVVQDHSDRVVLVTPTVQSSRTNIPEIATYHHLLPPFIGDNIQSAYDVTQIQGFFEFENEIESLESPARQAHHEGLFYYNDAFLGQTVGTFKSAPRLAIEKYQHHQEPVGETTLGMNRLRPWPIKINFHGESGAFPSLDFKQFCIPTNNQNCSDLSDSEIYKQIQNKIIIVGFIAPEDNKKVVLPIQSPFGTQTPGFEVQAHILASLLTHTAYYIPPRWLVQSITILGALLVSYGLHKRLTVAPSRKRTYIPFLILITLSVYGSAAILCLSQQILLPVVLPLLTWFSTGLMLRAWLSYDTQQKLIAQQRIEIAQLKSAESGAVILQTKKVLQRIASGIHEGPLQDLRLTMDKLEFEKSTEPDIIIEKLSKIGKTIRHHLQNIRNMANQLEVTQELRQGLSNGISQYLNKLRESGKLTIAIQLDLQTLEEPIFNSQWIDAREDIFMFFREAISNIITHAHPPHGAARQIMVSLKTVNDQCTLMIENDGYIPAQTKSSDPNSHYRQGGYGTQMMETVARSLPNGRWRKIILNKGHYQVELSWNQQFESKSLYDPAIDA